MRNIYKNLENYWKILRAERAAMIVDGEDYYRALHEVMREAKNRIMLVGWDLHSELRLIRDGNSGGYPVQLGKFLDSLVREKKGLQIYLLAWDFAMIYAMEREFFPRYKLQWRSHKNIHFCLDGAHPLGASQHQKMVVVDDSLAFVGGFDVSKWRWDTSEHLVDDARRKSPDGDHYPPFHDIQMVVDGDAAKAIAAICIERWQMACEKKLELLGNKNASDLWPESVHPDFADVDIAISRTLPEFKMCSEVREVERLYLDSIEAAENTIYIENQYLSSYRIGEALAGRLEEENGPEIVIVMPLETGGWLEQHTMDVLRGRVLRRMFEADRWNRLRVFYPRLADNPLTALMVHAKVMIIDDNFLRVGSSNLSNRSLGLDSECDLSVWAEDNAIEKKEKIVLFRNRLLAEHLGVPPDKLEKEFEGNSSLVVTVDRLRSGAGRTLVPIDPEATKDRDQWVPDSALLDPEKPIKPDELLDYFIDKSHQVRAYHHMFKIISLIAFVLGMAILWRWTPLGEWLSIESVLQAARWVEGQPYSPLIVLAAFLAGGLVSFPVTLMIIATIVIFGPWPGLLYTLLGTELSAMCMFLIGRLLGQDTVRKLSGALLKRLNHKLSKSGLSAVIMFRIVPIAPFSVINLIAGVSDVSLRDFAVGTLIGLLPGTIAIVFVGDQIAKSMKAPDQTSLTILGLSIVAVAAALSGLRWFLRARQHRKRR
ncbi:hypothetical protein FCL47_12535 [Desulfopila sp. IMCC35006]|uniref:VTT domain-containing protein n=1 Tax=Desulfopila sp. IMCC35006 TaxID=2569542 RepID=UPI0010AD2E51|nr:VTT domain-containing protein [Desulfopila sp. IMCC35006]TKB25912.1 hypothetical protein FCL47_12535 [Desulfopila sp. IMCC35006]